jgi:hypothetical protein
VTVTPKVLIAAKQAANTQTTQYTAPASTKAVVDKFTVTNTSANAASLSVNLVTTGGSPGASNLIVDARVIAPDECYTLPELVGQVLEAGGYISTLASAASALTIRCSGREIT